MAVATWKNHVPVVRVLLEESVKAKCKVNKFSMVGPWVCMFTLERHWGGSL